MSTGNVNDKLKQVLYELLDPSFTIADDTCLEKILQHVSNQLNAENVCNGKKVDLNMCVEWIHHVEEICKTVQLTVTVQALAVRLLAFIVNNEARFSILTKTNNVLKILDSLNLRRSENVRLNLSYATLLSSVVLHNEGRKWIVELGLWRDAVKFCNKNSSIYVTRESQKIIATLLNNLQDNENIVLVLKEALDPLLFYKHLVTGNIKDNKKTNQILSAIAVACCIVEALLINDNTTVPQVILENFQIESHLWEMLNTSKENECVEHVSKLLCLITFLSFKHKNCVKGMNISSTKDLEINILNLLSFLVNKKNLKCALKVIVHCQLSWHKMKENFKMDSEPVDKQYEFENQLLALQLMPILTNLTIVTSENEFFDAFVTKLCKLTYESTVRIAYLFRKQLKEIDKPQELAHISILAILQIKDIMNREQGVIVFQSLMYRLKEYMPPAARCPSSNNSGDTEMSYDYVIESPELLSSVLEALTIFIGSFRITWRESVETICLFTFMQALLSNPNLTTKECIQTLRLMREVIQNFMPPNLALLVNTLEGSSIKQLGPLLHKRLHDVHWEIRDSAMEVLLSVIRISDIKFPAFQDHLLEHELPALVVAMSLDDSESYVRASALSCLCAMVCVDKYWTDCLACQDLPNRAMAILQKESEGIVRKEAAALMGEMYDHQKLRPSILPNVYSTMATAAIGDLHWEVQINALSFWAKVIERHMSNQGMIDGVFPQVTFSRENRKIVTLTENEIKLRLKKVLNELSDLGCLQVLLTTLDDCNFHVICKSVSVVSSLLNILDKYDMLSSQTKCNVNKNSSLPENKRTFHQIPGSTCSQPKAKISESDSALALDEVESHSNEVIQRIMEEPDIALLESVYRDKMCVSEAEIMPMELSYISPDDFLSSLASVNLNNIVSEKRRWLDYYSNDLESLLNDILASQAHKESNSVDCY